MQQFDIVFDPGHKVILERTLDNLVKDIRGNGPVNIGAGEFPSEWLMRPGVRCPSVKKVRVRAMVGRSIDLINKTIYNYQESLPSRHQRCHSDPRECPSWQRLTVPR